MVKNLITKHVIHGGMVLIHVQNITADQGLWGNIEEYVR